MSSHARLHAEGLPCPCGEEMGWHEDGADVSPYLLVLLLSVLAVPVGLTAFLLMWVL